MRISDWSSYVCSSCLAVGCTVARLGIIVSFLPFLIALGLVIPPIAAIYVIDGFRRFGRAAGTEPPAPPPIRWPAIGVWLGSLAVTLPAARMGVKIGRASCRERVCQYV